MYKEGESKKPNNISVLARRSVKPGFTPLQKNDGPEILHGDPLCLTNGRTGELLEEWAYDARKEPKDWVQLYQALALEIADAPPGKFMALRLVFYVIGRAGFGNGVQINQSYLARRWGCSRPTIATAVKGLVRSGLIERMPLRPEAVSSEVTYRINPNFMWKGKKEYRTSRVVAWGAIRDVTPKAEEGEG